jgi:predicted methyltransferase
MKRLTHWVHEGLNAHVQPGDWVVDATLGNGHDTTVLLKAIGGKGKVFAFDLQSDAIESARDQFAECPQFEPFLRNHAELDRCLPADAKSRLSAVVFNLGYLPGCDRDSATETTSTIAALDLAFEWLATGGVLCCTAYPGSPAGLEESLAVSDWAVARADDGVHVTRIESVATRGRGPFVLWLEKR